MSELVYEKDLITFHFKGHTRISDFLVNGVLFEVKGVRGSHADLVVEAFEQNGYSIVLVTVKEINECKQELIKQGYDIDTLLKKIVQGHNTKQYFEFIWPDGEKVYA